ncbi:MAG: TIGR03790 family protein [Thermoguttaceae bacterium]|nr:TIGR03790 family protein [Thermoguttaceae bacterium]MDW8037728.1 TIGR03790 family protein [Thermoguttaceae bacterium]
MQLTFHMIPRTTRLCLLRRWELVGLLWVAWSGLMGVSALWAELTPEQIGLIAMADSPEGQQLAQHYAQRRGVPKEHILLLPGKPGDEMSRKDWETQARPAIRSWLLAEPRKEKIRCLVTCWDVPLRIGRRDPASPEVQARKQFLQQARGSHVDQLSKVLEMLESVGRQEKPPTPAPLDAQMAVPDIGQRLDAAIKAAQTRAQSLQGAELQKAETTLQQAITIVGGINTLLQVAAKQPESKKTPDFAASVALLQGRTEGILQGLRALESLPDSPARDIQIFNLLVQVHGLLGCLQWIDHQTQLLEKNETHASFDSELSLILWEDYPLFGWQPNLLHYAFDRLAGKRPVMMVSRLAAPSLQLAKGLVDTAIEVEKQGLKGKVYLDARGIPFTPGPQQRGSYGEYDQSLRDLADRLKTHTKLEVILDNDQKLFQPGQCPEAAIYCGWYSLGSYVDAFQWQPGAVGYHMASIEAVTLRDPNHKAWCPSMLARGVCATLGPVSEPYLAAFPLPDDFFSLLLTGKYSLVEVYYRTTPFTSWQMVLVGDPLYNPFRAKPALAEEHLPQRIRHPEQPAQALAIKP